MFTIQQLVIKYFNSKPPNPRTNVQTQKVGNNFNTLKAQETTPFYLIFFFYFAYLKGLSIWGWAQAPSARAENLIDQTSAKTANSERVKGTVSEVNSSNRTAVVTMEMETATAIAAVAAAPAFAVVTTMVGA